MRSQQDPPEPAASAFPNVRGKWTLSTASDHQGIMDHWRANTSGTNFLWVEVAFFYKHPPWVTEGIYPEDATCMWLIASSEESKYAIRGWGYTLQEALAQYVADKLVA